MSATLPVTSYVSAVPAVRAAFASSVYLDSIANKEMEREQIFLKALESADATTYTVAIRAYDCIKGNVPGTLRVPYVDIREDKGVLLTWDQGDYHLDVEIYPNGTLDFFYMNRNTNESWDIECNYQEKIPDQIWKSLNTFRVVS